MPRVIVNLDVPDPAAAAGFYVGAFGFSIGRRLEGGAMVELPGAGMPLYLLRQSDGSDTTGATRDYRRHWTPLHLDLAVDDLDAAAARAKAAGATMEGDIHRDPMAASPPCPIRSAMVSV